LQGASRRYGDTLALAPATLEIRASESVALVSPSGAGKTSLLQLLNGTLRASEGRVEVSGSALGEMSARALRRARSDVGFVQQDLGLVPNLRVLHNVQSGRLGRQGLIGSLASMLRPSRSALAEVHELLERVGIGDLLYERTDRLSGGEQQRVAIARALYQRPGALLADEPVSSVDPARARQTIGLLRSLSDESQLTLCVSLHDLELAREFFPRLIGLRAGRILFDRPSASVGPTELDALYSLDGDDPPGADEKRRDGG
jgi:phosphonate transport system ATP-binding protein